ncbi:toprim domain-containing protein [Variovorax sp. Varisp85]|uniref:toprim domain-containing protein n=1 Tax=Variovorax sp. Varisp85 TaxID=3243059 RepID=UPI0039A68025
MSAVDQFLSAIESAGLVPPAIIRGDGKLYRFSPSGRCGDNAGWYVLHLDSVPAGSFGNWRTGESQNWCAKEEHDLTDIERQEQRERIRAARRMHDAVSTRKQGEAASKALALWAQCESVRSHDYLTRKGIEAHGVRTDGHHLFVPIRDTTGELHSLQTISPDGAKWFMPGGRVRGCYHMIGHPKGRLITCEGYATGATIHEATGDAAAVTFSAGNLLSVAVALRAEYPSIEIIIAADDDWKTPGNPGLSAARLAAQAVGGRVAKPNFRGLPRADKDTDFNDLERLVEAVRVGRAV